MKWRGKKILEIEILKIGRAKMSAKRYPVVIEPTGTGYSAYSPDVAGCAAAGDTKEETLRTFQDALTVHFEAKREVGEPIPEPHTSVDYVHLCTGGKRPDKWLLFYGPMFASEEDARSFVGPLEKLGNGDPRHRAKIMMHQTQRLISLADDLPSIRPGHDSLRLLFLLICAEHIAKLFNDFTEDGKSRAYVQNFFKWFLSPEQQQHLCARMGRDQKALSLEEAVDVLYKVRCEVVHEGENRGFFFAFEDDQILNGTVKVSLPFAEFRFLIVMGCITAIQRYPEAAV
jgi:predicted RNase H-like HicB family nuclease